MRRSRATVAVYCLSRRLCINKKERDSKKNSTEMLQREQLRRGKEHYHIYSNKRRGAHVTFPATNVALILVEGGAYLNIVPEKFTFSIFLFNGTLSIC